MTVIEMNKQAATGISSLTAPNYWVVPPWAENAGVHEIVRHFLAWNPMCRGLSDLDEKAYYVGYFQALETASTHDLTCDAAWRWYGDMLGAVAECVSGYLRDDVVGEDVTEVA